MIKGVGVDACQVARLARALADSPGLERRIFTAAELSDDSAANRVERLAGHFAAKEALLKAVGGLSFALVDVAVGHDEAGAPHFELAPACQARLDALGITAVHLSISHDGGLAIALVVCEGER